MMFTRKLIEVIKIKSSAGHKRLFLKRKQKEEMKTKRKKGNERKINKIRGKESHLYSYNMLYEMKQLNFCEVMVTKSHT